MADERTPPDHLVAIGEGWHLWRCFRLRGTGFPAARVLDLAVPDLGAQLEPLFAAVDDNAAPARLASCVEAVKAHVVATSQSVRDALRVQARDARFQEAIVWQNRNAQRTGVESLLRQPPDATDARTRKSEQLVASYLQRYCTKNDTIGFFGPMGWGEISRDEHAATALKEMHDAGSELSRRTVYFEWWAINELAARLATDPALRPWLAPRRLPTVRVEGTRVHDANRRPREVTAAEAWVLTASDGATSARDIASRAESEGLLRADEAYALLRTLEQAQLLVWTLSIPTEVIHPERWLASQLQTIGDAAVRDPALAALGELERARDALTHADRTPATLATAFDDLDTVFTRLTDRRAARNEGRVYAGRAVVYEDCVRDGELTLGRAVIDRIGPALALVLESARWYSHALAQRYLVLLEHTYASLSRDSGQSAVEFVPFLLRVKERFATTQYEVTPLVAEVVAELRTRWANLLAFSGNQRAVKRSAAELASAVREQFCATGPGWPLARYHAPDLLLAATDLAAVARGEFLVVLGEVHVSTNTVLTPVFLKEFPRKSELLEARAREVGPCVAPVVPAKNAHRAALWSMVDSDFHIAIGSSVSWRPSDHVLPAADLIIERRDGALCVALRSGAARFDALTFFQDYFIGDACGHFSMLPSAPHTPRVSIDDLVVARERWCFEPDRVSFAGDLERSARLVAANRWAHQHGMPRFVFVKVPEEPKPFYVDFHSPVLVEVFAKAVRRASVVVVTEMLPAHGEMWLPDAEGNRYSCELRLAAVDPLVFSSFRGPRS